MTATETPALTLVMPERTRDQLLWDIHHCKLVLENYQDQIPVFEAMLEKAEHDLRLLDRAQEKLAALAEVK